MPARCRRRPTLRQPMPPPTMMTFTSVLRSAHRTPKTVAHIAAALCKNERNARATPSDTRRRFYEHAIPRRPRTTFVRRIAVSIANSRAVDIERRIHAGTADGEAARVRSAREGDGDADGEASRHEPAALLPKCGGHGHGVSCSERHVWSAVRGVACRSRRARARRRLCEKAVRPVHHGHAYAFSAPVPEDWFPTN